MLRYMDMGKANGVMLFQCKDLELLAGVSWDSGTTDKSPRQVMQTYCVSYDQSAAHDWDQDWDRKPPHSTGGP
jgi:hypothetical protein